VLFGLPPVSAAHHLGLGRPQGPGLVAAAGVSLLLLLVIPIYLAVTGTTSEFYRGWGWLVVGLLSQAGIAEETLFRGYLFRRIRQERPFWRAAALAMGLFVLHALVQGAIKIVSAAGEAGALMPLVWMAASATIPFLAFLIPLKSVSTPARARVWQG
jgi:membrane protease YdiL (CAAX protease family)